MIFEIFLGVLLVIEGYIIWNLFRKTELLETWVEDFTQSIETVQNELKKIDSTGHFESDDEVGFFFEQLKNIQKMLNDVFEIENEENNAEKKEK